MLRFQCFKSIKIDWFLLYVSLLMPNATASFIVKKN